MDAKRWMCDPESTHQHPEGQYVDLIDFVRVEKQNALLAAEVERLRGELDLTLKTHVYVSDEWNKTKKRLEKLEKRDEVWRGKKEMLENDLGKAWEQLARYREGFSGLDAAYKNYIKLLDEELGELTPLAYNHGWRSTRVESGQLARARIAEALKAVEDSPKVTESVTREE